MLRLSSIILLVSFVFSCKKKDQCKVEYVETTKMDTLKDYNTTSPHYLEKVAVFKLTDIATYYLDTDRNSYCATRDVCKAYLQIINITNQKLSMDYRIDTSSIGGFLNHIGQVTISAGETANIGLVTDDCIYLGYADYDGYGSNIIYY